MKLDSIITMVSLVGLVILFIMIFTTCLSITERNNILKQQNLILKEIAIELQEQNSILKYNPMEEEK